MRTEIWTNSGKMWHSLIAHIFVHGGAQTKLGTYFGCIMHRGLLDLTRSIYRRCSARAAREDRRLGRKVGSNQTQNKPCIRFRGMIAGAL